MVVGAAAVPPWPLSWQPASRTSAAAVTSADVRLIGIPSTSWAAVISEASSHRPTSVHVGSGTGAAAELRGHLAG